MPKVNEKQYSGEGMTTGCEGHMVKVMLRSDVSGVLDKFFEFLSLPTKGFLKRNEMG